MSLMVDLKPQNLINHVLVLEKSGLPIFYRQYVDSPLKEEDQVLVTGLLGSFINFSEQLDLGELQDVGFTTGRWFFYKLNDDHYLTICFDAASQEAKSYAHEQLRELAQYLFDKISVAFSLFWSSEHGIIATLDDENLRIFQQNFGQALDQILSEMAQDFELSKDQPARIIDLGETDLIGSRVVEGTSSTDISTLRRQLTQQLKKLLKGE